MQRADHDRRLAQRRDVADRRVPDRDEHEAVGTRDARAGTERTSATASGRLATRSDPRPRTSATADIAIALVTIKQARVGEPVVGVARAGGVDHGVRADHDRGQRARTRSRSRGASRPDQATQARPRRRAIASHAPNGRPSSSTSAASTAATSCAAAARQRIREREVAVVVRAHERVDVHDVHERRRAPGTATSPRSGRPANNQQRERRAVRRRSTVPTPRAPDRRSS